MEGSGKGALPSRRQEEQERGIEYQQKPRMSKHNRSIEKEWDGKKSVECTECTSGRQPYVGDVGYMRVNCDNKRIELVERVRALASHRRPCFSHLEHDSIKRILVNGVLDMLDHRFLKLLTFHQFQQMSCRKLNDESTSRTKQQR